MSDFDKLGDVIDSINSLAFNDSGWSSALRNVSDLIGGEYAYYIKARYENEFIVEDARDYGVKADRSTNFDAISYLDPKLPKLLRLPQFSIIADYDVLNEEDIDHHPFYQRFLFPDHLRYTISAKLITQPWSHGGNGAYMAVHRDPRRGHVDQRERKLMALIARHFACAATFGRHVHRASRIETCLWTSLDHLSDAFFIVKPDATFVDSNYRARSMLQEPHKLRLTRSVLTTEHPTTTKALHHLIASAAGHHLSANAGRSLSIPCSDSELRPLLVMTTRLPEGDQRQMFADTTLDTLVVLIVSDPNFRPPTCAERLSAMFGFTPAEAQLAKALAAGLSVSDYAANAKISANTVRWTLKRMLAKTDCHRQSEMIRLVSVLAATASAPNRVAKGLQAQYVE